MNTEANRPPRRLLLWHRLRHVGLALVHRTFPRRPAFTPDVIASVVNRHGLEIGGPSRIFGARGMVPIYARVTAFDNVNFAAETAWESRRCEGATFRFDPRKPPGRQFLREATALTGIADHTYDFVASSHCLEHVANPLAALREWRRVVRPGGHLLLVLPDPRHSFDHARPVTTLAHLRSDFDRATPETDETHLEEVLALHDLGRDLRAGSPVEFRARALRNAQVRCLHHHVFDLTLIRSALAETGWRVLVDEAVRPVHLIALAQRAG